VEDTGEGITAKTLPVIFNAFEQGETREAQAPGGLGLGLAISHAIIELHGGIISAESAGPGLGSIFTVQLATVLPFSDAQAPETQKSRQFKSGVRRLRLLVIEDHEPTMEVLARLLRSHGHDVLTACTVNVALSLAAAHSFDLVISDLGLPDGSGLDLMPQLAKEYGLRGVALSGYGMPQDRVNTQQAGFLAHLVKPINFEQLHQVLQEIAPTVEPTAISEASG
jgi:CheY-like chemotaxis protein